MKTFKFVSRLFILLKASNILKVFSYGVGSKHPFFVYTLPVYITFLLSVLHYEEGRENL